jgi:hypothetical protein
MEDALGAFARKGAQAMRSEENMAVDASLQVGRLICPGGKKRRHRGAAPYERPGHVIKLPKQQRSGVVKSFNIVIRVWPLRRWLMFRFERTVCDWTLYVGPVAFVIQM